ncbi:hypothetical protein [Streptomyces sp. NPDC060022]|uniref:hypothetical protein n=1 Tax=Streptomyces sp. NPDC060022 TaxID=3347039 RepID=UPI003692E426
MLRTLDLSLDTIGTQPMGEKSHLGHRPCEHPSPNLLERPLRLGQISAKFGAQNLHHEDRTGERITEYEPCLAMLGQKTLAQVVRYGASSWPALVRSVTADGAVVADVPFKALPNQRLNADALHL